MMHEIDALVKDKLVPMCNKVMESLVKQHPQVLGMVNNFLAGKDNRIGLQVTENGSTAGEYTFHLNGLHLSEVDCGVLSSELHHPIGIIKPYRIIEKSVLEKMLADETMFINEPFTAIRKYMPDITIKFLR